MLVDGSHMGRTPKLLVGNGLFVPSLAFAGSNQQNMQQVRDALIAVVRNESPQANAITDVMDPSMQCGSRADD